MPSLLAGLRALQGRQGLAQSRHQLWPKGAALYVLCPGPKQTDPCQGWEGRHTEPRPPRIHVPAQASRLVPLGWESAADPHPSPTSALQTASELRTHTLSYLQLSSESRHVGLLHSLTSTPGDTAIAAWVPRGWGAPRAPEGGPVRVKQEPTDPREILQHSLQWELGAVSTLSSQSEVEGGPGPCLVPGLCATCPPTQAS